MSDVTRILSAIERGDTRSADRLLPLVYDELRRLAAERLAHEKPGQTLQATALVHEVYIRLVDVEKAQHFNSRGHFFAVAAEAMRRILVENARRKRRLKRGGGRRRIDLDKADLATTASPEDLLALDEVIGRLAAEDATGGELVKLRYFAGMSVEQAGKTLGISRANAYRHWTYVRAWMQCELQTETDVQ